MKRNVEYSVAELLLILTLYLTSLDQNFSLEYIKLWLINLDDFVLFNLLLQFYSIIGNLFVSPEKEVIYRPEEVPGESKKVYTFNEP